MTNEELKLLKDKYNEIKDFIEDIGNLIEEKNKLEETSEDVMRYLQITNLLEKNRKYDPHNLEYDHDILIEALKEVKPSSTENLYVYMGTYKYEYDGDICHSSRGKKVSREDSSATYSLYKDIEKLYGNEVEVRIKDRENFEKNNNIIFPPRYVNMPIYYFEDTQYDYFIDSMKDGIEEVKKRLLKK